MPKRPHNREERLERCLRDVQKQLCDHAEYQERFVGADPKENETLQFLNRLCTRIHRSLKPRIITTAQIQRMLAQTRELNP